MNRVECLLINGYLRKIELQILFSAIPLDVKKLCFKFYIHQNDILILFKGSDDCININDEYGLFISDISTKQKWLTNVFELNPKKQKKKKKKSKKKNKHKYNVSVDSSINFFRKTQKQTFLTKNTTTYYAKNIILSKQIQNKLIYFYKKDNLNNLPNLNQQNIFNGILKLSVNRCSIIIFNKYQLFIKRSYKNEKITMFHWSLPSLPNILNPSLIYHNKYGLISIGGYHYKLGYYRKTLRLAYTLDINKTENKENFKWNKDIFPSLQTPRGDSSCFLSKDQSKLFIIGGYNDRLSVPKRNGEIFNFNDDNSKWKNISSMNNARINFGLFYDENTHLYVAGGYNNIYSHLKRIEYFDLYKNQWFNLQNTIFNHGRKPSVWIDDNNQYILNIASIEANCIESIDLRLNKSSSFMKLSADLFHVNTNNRSSVLFR